MISSGSNYDGAAVKTERGTDVTGRWVQYKILNDTTGNPMTRMTLDTITVSGISVDVHPSAR